VLCSCPLANASVLPASRFDWSRGNLAREICHLCPSTWTSLELFTRTCVVYGRAHPGKHLQKALKNMFHISVLPKLTRAKGMGQNYKETDKTTRIWTNGATSWKNAINLVEVKCQDKNTLCQFWRSGPGLGPCFFYRSLAFAGLTAFWFAHSYFQHFSTFTDTRFPCLFNFPVTTTKSNVCE